MPLPDSDDFASYGGELADYRPVEDPSVDQSAAGRNAAYASVASMTRTAIRGFVRFSVSGGVASIESHDAVWGNGILVTPTIARNATGDYTITLPATVLDSLGDEHAVNVRACFASLASADIGLSVYVDATINVVSIKIRSGSSAADPSDVTSIFFL